MTAPPAAPDCVVDLGTLTALTGCDDPAMLAEFFNDFLDIAHEADGEMRSAAQAGDLATLGHVAHRVKSSARYVGAGPLGDLSEALEQAAKAGLALPAHTLLAQWQQEWQRVDAFLAQHLADAG